MDVFEGMTVEKVEKHGFQLDKSWVGLEEGGGKVHERSVTGGRFGGLTSARGGVRNQDCLDHPKGTGVDWQVD